MLKKNSLTKYFIFLALGIILSFVILNLYVNYLKEKSISNVIKDTEFPHKTFSNEIKRFTNTKILLVKMLSNHRIMHEYLANESSDKKEVLKELFSSTLKTNDNFMQIRLLDLKGVEKVRLDQSPNGLINIIEDVELQNKFNREYIKDFLKLKRGELGFSKFNLNVENNIVQKPFVPTLRIGYKLYLNNVPKGILIINMYMNNWIEEVQNTNRFKISIIDKNNYFKTHYDKNWEWSQYLNPPKKVNEYPFFDKVPKWQSSKEDYFIMSDNSIGRVLTLFNEDVLTVYKVPKSIKKIIFENLSSLLITIFICTFFVFIPITLILRNIFLKSKENEIFQKTLIENMFDSLILVNDKGIIKEINPQTEIMFGYKKSALLEKNIKILFPNYKIEKNNNYEIKALCKDGKFLPVLLTTRSVTIDEEKYFIKTIRDMKKIKDLEDTNRQQQELIFHQAKLASMGEMIGAIAHQWRQPLNEISIRIQTLKIDYKKGKINEEFIQEFISKNKETVSFMSNIIDDFRNFFRIDKQKTEFEVKKAIESVVNMQSALFQEKNIKVNLDLDDYYFNGFKNEFKQVVMILINNAKDVLIENNIIDAEINITLKDNILSFEDNAGGIPEELLNKIFEPYFTTKDEGKGTGMGLYLAKIILEDNMGCIFKVKNNTKGAVFIIEFIKDIR